MAKKNAANSSATDDNKSKKMKQASYTASEDEHLTKVWCSATLNEIKGNYQDKGKYWSKLCESYNAEMQKAKFPYRSIDSLQARWRKINHGCTKFNGVVMQF